MQLRLSVESADADVLDTGLEIAVPDLTAPDATMATPGVFRHARCELQQMRSRPEGRYDRDPCESSPAL